MEPTLGHKLWYLAIRLIYAVGLRPQPISRFYSYSLAKEEQWRTGR